MFDEGLLDELDRVLDRVLASFDSPVSAPEAAASIRAVESCARKLAAVQVQGHAVLESSGVHRLDAYRSAKAMVRHCGRLSPAAAAARARGARMATDLPDVWAALTDGSLGVDQYELLSRVHANPRVRHHMVDAQAWFLRIAERLSFDDFRTEVRTWERHADEDGPEPANSASHEARNASLVQDPVDLGWTLRGSCGAFQGAAIDEIFRRYVDAERLADWEKARAEHGDEAVEAHLARTDGQRRADALWQVFQDAASAEGTPCGVDVCHNIVWNETTFEEMLRRLGGETPRRLDPAEVECRTLDGAPLEPMEAAADALVSKVRRVVVDAAGVVIDLGRARFFTGGARLAAQLADHHCPWPGCSVPTSRCEIDHTVDHARGGRTEPANGGPFCGRHNRWKQKGFRVWRDPTGRWHVYRRDGTEID